MEFIPYIIAVLVVFIVLKILALPMKLIIKVLINSIIGGIVIYGLSLIGIGLTITWLKAGIVGLLGIPGVIIALIMQFVFHI